LYKIYRTNILLQPISCFFFRKQERPRDLYSEILLRATKEVTGKKTEQQVYKQGKEEKRGERGVRKQKKRNKKIKAITQLALDMTQLQGNTSSWPSIRANQRCF